MSLPDDLDAIAERLERDRPVPAAGYRGDLRRRLLAAGAAGVRPRPARLWLLVAGFASAGGALLVVAAASVV